MTTIRRLVDWALRDRTTGRIVIAQWPNLPLWIFFATVGLRRVADEPSAWRTVVDGAGVAALGWWAADEVIRGVNPWRRLLGVVGVVLTLRGLVAVLS